MRINNSALDDDADHIDEEVEYHPHQHLSRLSMCTSNSKGSSNGDDTRLFMSMQASDGEDADGELSDKEVTSSLVSSDSEKGPNCYSLPATPPRRRIGRGVVNQSLKHYASENEADQVISNKRSQRRKRSSSSASLTRKWMNNYGNHSGESECVVITRPKGGSRSLCMDLEEVKACRDLGFELEHEMLELPARISMSCSTIDDSSGGNSPIANWRISSPGDDPKDVKARLKVWAQAVALASTTRLTP